MHVATRVPDVLGIIFWLQKWAQGPRLTLSGIGGASGCVTWSVRTDLMCAWSSTLPFFGWQSEITPAIWLRSDCSLAHLIGVAGRNAGVLWKF